MPHEIETKAMEVYRASDPEHLQPPLFRVRMIFSDISADVAITSVNIKFEDA